MNPLSHRESMGAKGKSALRSALDQATTDRMKFLKLMTLPFMGARLARRLDNCKNQIGFIIG